MLNNSHGDVANQMLNAFRPLMADVYTQQGCGFSGCKREGVLNAIVADVGKPVHLKYLSDRDHPSQGI